MIFLILTAAILCLACAGYLAITTKNDRVKIRDLDERIRQLNMRIQKLEQRNAEKIVNVYHHDKSAPIGRGKGALIPRMDL